MEEESNGANESKPEEPGSGSVPENQTPATTPATEEPDLLSLQVMSWQAPNWYRM